MEILETHRLPIYNWATDLEQGAKQQAINLALHPYTYDHVAIMPDCLTEDTEILTPIGFKLIKNILPGELISNVDPVSGNITFLPAKATVNRALRINEKVYEFNIPNMNKSIKTTESHRMAYIEDIGITAHELPRITSICDFMWYGNGMNTPDYNISDELLCLIAWVVGDGNIKKSNKRLDGELSSKTIRFGFTKKRKITRVCNLLNALEYKYSIKHTHKQTTISLDSKSSKVIIDFVGTGKEYPVDFIYKLSTRQTRLFLDEAIQVDGDYVNFMKFKSYRFNSHRKSDIDFLSALISIHIGVANSQTRFTKTGMYYVDLISPESITESASGYGKGKVVRNEVKYDKSVVCVTCDTGFFIARQNGLTFISGNSHQGYGMPIGGVIATKSVIIPEAVGVDIGCGMQAVKTSLSDMNMTALQHVVDNIKSRIPVGFSHRSESLWAYMPPGHEKLRVVNKEYDSACHQLGTLGGGNHFIEIQQGDDGYIWMMVHSGSRNLGKKVADHYIKMANQETADSDVNIPRKWELDYLYVKSPEGQNYIKEMNYCLEFAKANRTYMMKEMREAMSTVIPTVSYEPSIDIHHNYAEPIKLNDLDLVLHRKGATAANRGQLGIIPGSQGTASYIVEGRGNGKSFCSCSHGSGRRMARGVAKRTLNLDEEREILDRQMIIHDMISTDALDEAPSAYKNIELVMANQKDLVKPLVRLTTRAVIKG